MKRNARIICVVVLLLIASASLSEASGRYVTGRYWQGPLQFYKDQSPVSIGVNPIIINGVTYVPIRATSQLLGMSVSWDQQNRRVVITSDQTQQANLSYYTDQVSKKQDEINKINKDMKDQKKDYEEKLSKLEKERDAIQKKYDDLLKSKGYANPYGYPYGYYGYSYGDIQSALNSGVSSTNIDGFALSASYSVSGGTNGNYSCSVNLSGSNKNAISRSGIASFLQTSVVPYFTRNGYYGSWYDGSWYDRGWGSYRGEYYDSAIISDYRSTHGSDPSPSKYIELYYAKHGYYPPSGYDYRGYGGYWGGYGDYRYQQYYYNSISFTVYDKGSGTTTTYTANSSGIVN